MFEQLQRDDRGAVESIGFFLIFALIVIVVVISSVTVMESMNEVKSDYKTNNAENAMKLFSDAMTEVYREHNPKQTVQLKLNGGRLQAVTTSTIKVTVTNTDTGNTYTYGPEPSNTVTIQTQDAVIAYQYGALFRIEDEGKAAISNIGAFMVEQPPFEFSPSETTLPLLDIEGHGAVGGSGTFRTQITHDRSELKYHQEASDRQYRVTIRIETTRERAKAWKDYFNRQGLTKTGSTDVESGVVEYKYRTEAVTIQRQIIDVTII